MGELKELYLSLLLKISLIYGRTKNMAKKLIRFMLSCLLISLLLIGCTANSQKSFYEEKENAWVPNTKEVGGIIVDHRGSISTEDEMQIVLGEVYVKNNKDEDLIEFSIEVIYPDNWPKPISGQGLVGIDQLKSKEEKEYHFTYLFNEEAQIDLSMLREIKLELKWVTDNGDTDSAILEY